MKIGFLGEGFTEGKVKYIDDRVVQLAAKFEPKKVTPFFVEFIKGEFSSIDASVIIKERLFDFLFQDIEKLDSRLSKTESPEEKELLKKCLSALEKEIPLCNVDFTEKEKEVLRVLAPVSFKPVLAVSEGENINSVISKILKVSGTVFFYTAGKKEVRAWPVRKGLDIVSCAGKIHSDLARGFIKADVINFDKFISFHNMNEAKAKGLVSSVGREYMIQDGDIIEIKFNV